LFITPRTMCCDDDCAIRPSAVPPATFIGPPPLLD
jgi:hypothetical protein